MADTKAILVVVILVVGGFFAYNYLADKITPGPLDPGEAPDGIYDADTQTCLPPSRAGIEFYTCCLNEDRQQVACATGELIQAVYQGTPGIFYVFHGVTVTNTGNVDMTKAYIESAIWSPSNTELNSAYAVITGTTYGKPINKGLSASWSSGEIDLQAAGTGTYDLTLTVRGQATNLPDSTESVTASITIETEAIGFSVNVNLGI